MNTIAIANQKGGCGKTTTAINLAAELGNREVRVLLIDMDPQGHASLGLGIRERDLAGLYEVFSDEVSLFDVVVSDVVPGVDLIPANISLAATEPMLTDQPGRERQLLRQIEELGEAYDQVLIDCPPSLGLLSINALRAAKQILTPVEASMFAMDGIKQLQNIVDLLAEKYQLEIPVKVVPTMFDTHTRFAHTILREIGEQLQVGLSNVQIRHTVRVREAAYIGQPVSQYAPDSTAAKDYRRLADEILTTFEKPLVTRLDHHSETSIHAEEHEETAMGQASAKSRRQMVVLTFNDIDCRRLQLAGDFNNWVPDRDIETRNVNGHWQKVFTAEPGVYEYRLIIDGRWQHDPTNPAEIPNELGGINSLLQVPVHH